MNPSHINGNAGTKGLSKLSDESLHLRRPRMRDGEAVYDLVAASKPLDLNSRYSYFLLCSHFAETCVVAEEEGRIMGFISAYRVPAAPDVLFVWQVAVDGSWRGRGLAGRMLEDLLSRDVCSGVRRLETSVTPSNRSSRRFFENFAGRHGMKCTEEPFLPRDFFGVDAHEEEVLLRIEPGSDGFVKLKKES